MSEARRLHIFGFGYTARALAQRLALQGWRIAAAPEPLAGATHILSTAPPDGSGDPILARQRAAIVASGARWIGYLSTSGVYGDTEGAWVDERAPPRPGNPRSQRRLAAERAWQALGAHIFRLAGIYGPGRSAIDELRQGRARRIDKPGHVFSRIHVEDIAALLEASMRRPDPGAIYNVADDEPAAAADVVDHAARLLGLEPPPLVAFETADLSPMAREFYAECRRVRNGRIKRELGIALRYPTYREGLRALL